ncbi:hypothetical protein BH23PLA1_BH23PLA1_38250 [soil metagenome]
MISPPPLVASSGERPGQAIMGGSPSTGSLPTATPDPRLYSGHPYDFQTSQAAWGEPAPVGLMQTEYQPFPGMPGGSLPGMAPGPLNPGASPYDPAIEAWHSPGSPYQAGLQPSARPGVLNKLLGIPNFGRLTEARRMRRALRQGPPAPSMDYQGRPLELPAGMVY